MRAIHEAVSLAGALLGSGVGIERIVTDGVESAMSALDAACTSEQFNLLEIMLVGRAVMEVMKRLFPAGAPVSERRGTVVIAALEGDVHDLGKNIVKMVLTGNGYRVGRLRQGLSPRKAVGYGRAGKTRRCRDQAV